MGQGGIEMNANELADELDEVDAIYGYEVIFKAQDMLRQQQLRIDQLLETQDYLYKTHDADKAEIEALKRDVAWAKDQWNKDRINLLSQLKTLNRDYRFMKDLAIGTEDLLKKASEK
jgi:hypothetical protein